MNPVNEPRPPAFAHIPEPWTADAACLNHNPELWFAGDNDLDARHEAYTICGTCPVRVACLEFAIRTNSTYGVWGGASMNRRAELGRARKQGRESA